MKKLAVILLVLSLVLLAGCACKHEWKEATCEAPKTCDLCGETEGEPLGHTWEDATCTKARTCKTCSETQGEPLPHTFSDATCEVPKTCTVCAATDGKALGHTWEEATYTTPKTCTVCAATEGDVLRRTDLGISVDDMVAASAPMLGNIACHWELLQYYENEHVFRYVLRKDGEERYYPYFADFYLRSKDDTNVYQLMIQTVSNDPNIIRRVWTFGCDFLLQVKEDFDTDSFLSSQPVTIQGMSYYYMEDQGLAIEMQVAVSDEYCAFCIYPVEDSNIPS